MWTAIESLKQEAKVSDLVCEGESMSERKPRTQYSLLSSRSVFRPFFGLISEVLADIFFKKLQIVNM